MTAALLLAVLPAAGVQASPGVGVNLRVLLFTHGDEATQAIAAVMDREGVPYTEVNLESGSRPAINDAFLVDPATGRGRFQAVVVPSQPEWDNSFAVAERTALFTYEQTYGVRQVDAYQSPGASTGQNAASFTGPLDGATVGATSDARTGAFAYLPQPMTLAVDDFDPAVDEAYGYLAQPLASDPNGTFTTLLTATSGGNSGPIVGVYSHNFREELIISVNYNADQQWFNELSHGIITWMTRGTHLGYHRNYFAVHVDDIFMADSRWSSASNCTPGDTPSCNYGAGDNATHDIRMTAPDVTYLVNWQNTHDFKFDMLFNAYGSDSATAPLEPGGATRDDPLTDAFLTNQAEFLWANHTYSHPFLGCIQIAPTTPTGDWHCATPGETGPYYDEDLAVDGVDVNGTMWLSYDRIFAEITQNQQWATAHGLTNFDSHALVTGEHSGLKSGTEQTIDNPFLAQALLDAGITYTGSDASREADSRFVEGSTTTKTLPRHPMNIFYNAGTYADEVDEYNWIYTDTPTGSGICHSDTSTCITPLDNGNASQSEASFKNYIVPIEVRNAYRYVISGDPRPFYAHQSNLAESRILYPVVEGILAQYAKTHNTTVSPLVTEDTVTLGETMQRSTEWATEQSGVTAYLDANGVHVAGPDGTQVPLTVPAGTPVSGDPLESYDGELSGWLNATAPGAVVATPTAPLGGYIGHTVPDAPTVLSAAFGAVDTPLTLTWAAPVVTGNSDIIRYEYEVSLDTATPSWSTTLFPGLVTSTSVFDLDPTKDYIFRMRAVNAVGAGPWSTVSPPVQRLAEATVVSPDVVYGTAATVTLNVATSAGHAPSGTATLDINGTTATAPIVGNTATFSVPSLLVGNYPYTVSYGSDVHILPFSLTGSVTVTKAAVTATGALLTAPTPVQGGTYQVTVIPPSGLVAPTGTATLTLTNGSVTKDPISGPLDGGTVTLNVPALPAGTWTASVAYSGDSNYTELSPVAGADVVSTKASVGVVGSVGTVPTPQTTGTYSVSVTQGTGLPDATGGVSVTLTNGSVTTVPFPGTLGVGGTATIDLPKLPAGTWDAMVTYEGDDNYALTTVAGASVVSVKAAVTAVGAVTLAPSPQKPGTYKVTVTQPDGLAAPTGNVTVTFANGAAEVEKTVEVINGVGTVELDKLPAGTWTASIAYTGDDNYTALTTTGADMTSNPDEVAVAGAVGDAPNPQEGGTYLITVTQPEGLEAPTGNVTLTLANELDTFTKTVGLINGAATVPVDSLHAGSWNVTIAYSGDLNYAPKSANPDPVTSTRAVVTIAGTVGDAPSPQHGGTYAVAVTQPDGLDVPTGNVTLTLTKGSDTYSDTAALDAGVAGFDLPSLAAGTWTASITYAGDDNYGAAPTTGESVESVKADVSTVVGAVITKPTTTTAGSFSVTVTPPSGLTPPPATSPSPSRTAPPHRRPPARCPTAPRRSWCPGSRPERGPRRSPTEATRTTRPRPPPARP
ncbi:MAG: Ig-like domain repeat protein [Demequina sp.]|nr:Ig-like domain repeat protein [Demequina sp.]